MAEYSGPEGEFEGSRQEEILTGGLDAARFAINKEVPSIDDQEVIIRAADMVDAVLSKVYGPDSDLLGRADALLDQAKALEKEAESAEEPRRSELIAQVAKLDAEYVQNADELNEAEDRVEAFHDTVDEDVALIDKAAAYGISHQEASNSPTIRAEAEAVFEAEDRLENAKLGRRAVELMADDARSYREGDSELPERMRIQLEAAARALAEIDGAIIPQLERAIAEAESRLRLRAVKGK